MFGETGAEKGEGERVRPRPRLSFPFSFAKIPNSSTGTLLPKYDPSQKSQDHVSIPSSSGRSTASSSCCSSSPTFSLPRSCSTSPSDSSRFYLNFYSQLWPETHQGRLLLFFDPFSSKARALKTDVEVSPSRAHVDVPPFSLPPFNSSSPPSPSCRPSSLPQKSSFLLPLSPSRLPISFSIQTALRARGFVNQRDGISTSFVSNGSRIPFYMASQSQRTDTGWSREYLQLVSRGRGVRRRAGMGLRLERNRRSSNESRELHLPSLLSVARVPSLLLNVDTDK